MKRKLFALAGTALLLSACSLLDTLTTSTTSSDSKKEDSSDVERPTLTLEKSEGYTLKFNNVNASYYIVKDSNDYRDEIKITGNKTADYFYYTPEVVGKHDVFVKAYGSNNEVISLSNHVDSVEVEPVYSYIPFSEYFLCSEDLLSVNNIPHSLWEQAEATFGHKDKHFFFLDDNLNWTINGAYNTEDYLKKGDCANFTKNQTILDKIFKNLKDTGNNVVLVTSNLEHVEKYKNWAWWYLSDDDNNLMRFMNEAWKHGLKCIIQDNAIFSATSRGTEKYTGSKETLKTEVQTIVESRLLHKNADESNLMLFLKHPAFYGFNFPDEPYPDSATFYSIGYASQKINEIYSSNTAFKKWNKPVIFTCCLPFADFIFEDKAAYVSYIKDWITYTQTRYINFDMYTYTTMSYGTNKKGEYFCDNKIVFEAYDEVRKQYPDFKITQTINGGNTASRYEQTYADIYASHFLTLAMKFNGYGTFIFSPFDSVGEWHNPIVNQKQERSKYFPMFEDANKKMIIGKGLLDGYEVENVTVNQEPESGYGYGKKELIVEFKNGTKTAKMYVNYETDINKSTDVSLTKTVEKDHDYYIFKKDSSPVRNNRKTDQNIKIEKAEALLVF